MNDAPTDRFLGEPPPEPSPLTPDEAVATFGRILARAATVAAAAPVRRRRARWAGALAAAGVLFLAAFVARNALRESQQQVARRGAPEPKPRAVVVVRRHLEGTGPSAPRQPGQSGRAAIALRGQRPAAGSISAPAASAWKDDASQLSVRVVERPAGAPGYASASAWAEDRSGGRHRVAMAVDLDGRGDLGWHETSVAERTDGGPILSVSVRRELGPVGGAGGEQP